MSIYEKLESVTHPTQIEVPLYGSDRLGMWKPGLLRNNNNGGEFNIATVPDPPVYTRNHDGKLYELKDHLGNVRVVIRDWKVNGATSIRSFIPKIVSYSGYYPFGMQMHEDTWESPLYRYGYNGKEKDGEIKGEGNSYDYGARMYDSRAARFLKIDPLSDQYPWYSPYQFAGNTPIQAVDMDGLEPFFVMGTEQDLLATQHPEMRESVIQLFYKYHPDQKGKKVNFGFSWQDRNSTLNTESDRKAAAEELVKYVLSIHKKGEPITLMGYSHGNNVDLQAVKGIREGLDAMGENDTPLYLMSFSSPSYNVRRDPENPLNVEKYFTRMDYFYTYSGIGGGDWTILGSSVYSGAEPAYYSRNWFQKLTGINAYTPLETSKIHGHKVDLTQVAGGYSGNPHAWIFNYDNVVSPLFGTPYKSKKSIWDDHNDSIKYTEPNPNMP